MSIADSDSQPLAVASPASYQGRNSDTSSATPDTAANHSPARSLRRSMARQRSGAVGSGAAAPGMLRENTGGGRAGRAGPLRGKPGPRRYAERLPPSRARNSGGDSPL